ncbi:YczE/YyaS/YitT family protein [Terrisporobacter sp.]
MNKIISTIFKLLLGFVCCAFGTVMALQSNLGLSPWDVFHQGLSNITGLTIGQMSITVGIIVVTITLLLKLEIGLGTIANMIIIGMFTDLIIYIGIIPKSTNLISGVLMLIGSLVTMSIGSYLYISCGIGCGPRDGLMVALVRITGKSVRLIRFLIELSVLIIGFILGGKVVIGTLITVMAVGYCVQVAFKIFKFDVKKLKHRNIKESFVFLSESINSKEGEKNGI